MYWQNILPWVFPIGYANIQTIINVHLLPDSVVQSMLPPELKLMHPSIFSEIFQQDDVHPVIFQFNSIAQEHPLIKIFKWNYLLVNITIPYVRCTHFWQGPLVFTPVAFITKELPLIAGKVFFGLAKTMAEIGISKTDAIVNDISTNLPLLIGEFEAEGDPGSFQDFEAQLSKFIVKAYGQTTIGTSFLLPVRSNTYFDFSSSYIQPVKAKIKVCQPFLPNLPVGNFSTDSILSSPVGSFAMTSQISISLPYPTVC